MKSEVHGINCSCCEPVSLEATQILDEINKILNELGPANIQAPKDATIKSVEEVVVQLAPLGDISALAEITKVIFSLPEGDLDFEAVALEDSEKRIGKFKVSEISEHPGVDITKIVELPESAINSFDSIKIGITTPTVTAVKTMSLGPVSVQMDFRVGVGSVSWNPSQKFKTPEEALQNLEGATFTSILTEAEGTSLEELKKLSKEQFSDNINALGVLGATKTIPEFFAQLASLQLNLIKEVDVAEEASKIFKDSEESKKIDDDRRKSQECSPTDSLTPAVYRTDEISSIADELCKTDGESDVIKGFLGDTEPGSTLIKNVIPDLRIPGKIAELGIRAGQGIRGECIPEDAIISRIEGEKNIIHISSPADCNRIRTPLSVYNLDDTIKIDDLEVPDVTLPGQEDETQKIQSFLSDLNPNIEEIKKCSVLLNEANNRYNAFLQLKLLNKISARYFDTLTNFIESYYGNVQTILARRDTLISDLAFENRKVQIAFDEYNDAIQSFNPPIGNSAIISAFDQIPGTDITVTNYQGGADSISSLAGTINTSFLLGILGSTAATNSTSGTSGLASGLNSIFLGQQRNAAQTLQNNLDVIELRRSAIINELQNLENQFNQYKIDVSNIADYTPSVGTGTSQQQSIEDFLKNLRKPLSASDVVWYNTEATKISNLVGYASDGFAVFNRWTVKVAPTILDRANQLWNDSKNSPGTAEQGYTSDVTAPLNSYINLLNVPRYDNDSGSLVADRKGLYEDAIWNYYNSHLRYDYFFTYSEQGYNKPKPQYDLRGNLIGQKVQKTVKNGLGEDVVIESPADVEGLEVDNDIAEAFWKTADSRLRAKIEEKAIEIETGPVYTNYIQNVVYNEARKEAALAFFADIDPRGFLDSERGVYAISPVQDFRRKSYVINLFSDKISQELIVILDEIAAHQKCINDNQATIEDKAKKLAGSSGTPDSSNLAEECKRKLGIDPVGQKPGDGKCPNYTKDCYWKEYTKIMQQVSLMPIIELDPTNLSVRLFRYYPVAIQIPVPPAPGPTVLPTLAMGKPDPMISIPLPLVWKHIISFSTPLGTIVIWIALSGPIPNPFIALFDEKGDATFMVTPRGPCSIPHPTVGGTNPLEEKSLAEILIPPNLVKISLKSPLGKLLCGNPKLDTGNPDSGKNVIDKFKEKIKSAFDQLEIPDPPSIGGNSAQALEKKKRIKEAFEKVPPDAKAIEDAINEVAKIAENSIDKIKISGIKIPKEDKKLQSQTLGPAEVIDNLKKAIDTAAAAPGEIGKQVLKDLGVGISTISVTKKLKELARNEVSRPNVKAFFAELDQEIAELEASLSVDANISAQEKIEKRVEIVKKVVKKPLEQAAGKVNPALLGFAAASLDQVPLPFPCFKPVLLPVVPPYIYLIIAAIKAAPSIIDALPATQIAGLIAGEISLEGALPSAEQLFYNSINGMIAAVPDIVVPNAAADNMFKETINMVKQIPFKFKVRLPKPGLPMQITIPPQLIKAAMKQAAGAAIQAMAGVLIAKVYEAINQNNTQKIIAVALIIKALFGVGLDEIKGSDIKSFINGVLEASVYPILDVVSVIVTAANALSGEFLSIIELFQFPPKLSVGKDDGPFFYVGDELLRPIVDNLLKAVLPAVFDALPIPLVLLACSNSAARLAFTKIHPTKPFERLPVWEHMSKKNLPFVIWLDYLVATAQRKSGIGSSYLLPYQAIP